MSNGVAGIPGPDVSRFLGGGHSAQKIEDDVAFILSQVSGDDRPRILDLGCGAGLYSVSLAQKGCQVTGVDASDFHLVRARGRAAMMGLSVDFQQHDLRELPLAGEFDIVLCLSTTFGFYESRQDNLQVLRRARRALVPDGRLILDVQNRDHLVRNFQPRTWSETAGRFLLQEMELDPHRSRLENRWLLISEEDQQTFTFSHWVYSSHDLIANLHEADLFVLGLFSGLKDLPFQYDSPHITAVARKGSLPD